EQRLAGGAAAEEADAAVSPAGGGVTETAEQGPEGPVEETAPAAEEEPVAAAPAPAEATAPEGGGDGTEAVAGVELVLEPLPPLVLPTAPFLEMPREQARFTAPPLLVLERRTPVREPAPAPAGETAPAPAPPRPRAAPPARSRVPAQYAAAVTNTRRQQQSLAGRAESLLAQAAASYSSVVSQLAGDLLQADAQLSASFGQAQTTILAASLAADDLIDQQFEDARRQLSQARRSGLAAVRQNAETAADQITAIVADLSADYVTLLDDVSWDAEMTSLAAYDAVESWGASVNTLFPDSGTGLQRAENEARRKAAPSLVTEALSQLATRSFDVTSSYNEASTSLQADIRNGLEPTLQEHATRVNTQG